MRPRRPLPAAALATGLSLLMLATCSRGSSPQLPELPEHRLGFGGDVFLGRALNVSLFDRGARQRVFADMKPLFGRMDVVLINAEGVISGGGFPTDKGELQSQHYRAHPLAVDLLTDAGVDLVTIGNNHSGDYGPDALGEMLDRLGRVGIGWAGGGRDAADARRPVYRRVGDTVVAIVGADLTGTCKYAAREGRPGSLCFAAGDPAQHDRIVQALGAVLREARRHAHVVVLSPHWGPNKTEEPIRPVRALARRLMALGFDAILGTSAHWIHGVELFDGRPVVYDAGNLMVDYDGPSQAPDHCGVFWEVVFSRDGVRRLIAHPIALTRNRTRPATGAVAEHVLAQLVEKSEAMGTKLLVDGGLATIQCDPGEELAPDDPEHVPTRAKPDGVREAPRNLLLTELPASATPAQVTFPGGISLVGYELVLPALATPWPMQMVHTYWKTDRRLTARINILVRAVRAGSGQRDRTVGHVPGDWIFPTTEWPVAKIVDDRILVPLPRDATGAEQFLVGLGRDARMIAPTESSLPRADDSMVRLGEVPLRTGVPRLFQVLRERSR